ncbi:MAG: hypothetical protein KH444_11400 [Ruminococcus sp.]|nr:hypothetical protein [Ruminococcus sp.]
MAKIGLKCPVAAQITGYDSATGAPTYGNGFIIGKAVTRVMILQQVRRLTETVLLSVKL